MKAILNKNIDGYNLTYGKVYDVEPTPIIYNPNTFEPAPPEYIVKCDDNLFRKLEAKHFISVEDERNRKLDILLKK